MALAVFMCFANHLTLFEEYYMELHTVNAELQSLAAEFQDQAVLDHPVWLEYEQMLDELQLQYNFWLEFQGR